ncbi:MAG: DUF4070 domain-containing protein [Syntrophorhabdales bacterium]
MARQGTKVLLVYPQHPDTFWSYKYALKFISKKASSPPLGLLTVAAMLPADWEIRLIDTQITPLEEKDIEWADYVFISAMSIQEKSARLVITRCGAKGVKTVAGGPLFTSMPDAFPDVDYLVLDEAEITLPLFLKDLRHGRPRHIYRSGSRADIGLTPSPRWDIIDMKKYASMNIQYSRGCPFDCEFCNITVLYGQRARTKGKGQIIAELDGLWRAGWKGSVFFVDDNFIGNKTKLKRDVLPGIVDWMKRRRYPFAFATEVSINLADDRALMELMVEAGFDTVFVGIETPNETSLAECRKFQNENRDLMACVKTIQRSGLQVQGGFIVGFDNDPPSIFDRLTHFIQESGIVTAMVGLLNAPRGTRLYTRLGKEGRLLSEITGDHMDLSINFVPKMNLDVLVSGYQRILQTIYSPRCYYDRVRCFLSEYAPGRNKIFHFRVGYVNAFLRSVLFLGIIGRERIDYWKLLLWSLFRHPRLVPLAIQLAICGFHFRKVSSEMSSHRPDLGAF